MNNIQNTFTKKQALIPYITCGDPDLETTKEAILLAGKNGADMIILGIPFSDPTAEDGILQASNLRARQNEFTTEDVFHLVETVRKDVSLPIVFMTYANVVFSYGTESFLSRCKDANVQGLFFFDLPYEEKEEFAPLCRKYGVTLLSQVASASKERITMIAKEAEGFLYIAPTTPLKEIASMIRLIREVTNIPCVISSDQKETDPMADGIITDTAIVSLLETYGKNAPSYIGNYIRQAKQG